MVGNTNSHLCFSLFTFGIILLQVNEVVAPGASFDLPIENVTATEGATAILPCSVKFLGRHQVVWLDSWSTLLTFNDRRIINDQRISIERPFVSDWNLHIRNVGHNDQGTYECQVNTVPEKKKVVNLKVQGAPILLFANRKDIRETVPGGISKVIVPDLNNAVAVDFIFSERIIFWTDVTTDRIMRAYFDDYQNTTVVIDKGILSPVGLACDWLNMKLYWISSETNQIEVSNLDGTFRKVLFWDELDQPRAIALDPANGYIYWTDWGIHPKIEKAGMDGNKFTRSIIIEENIYWPNGLAIDYDDSKLYWTDAKVGYIHGCDLDGSNRREVVTESLPHPFGITVYDKMLYWTDWITRGIHRCDKLTGTQRAVVLEGDYSPMDIKAFTANKQPKGVNPCGENNGGCSHLCLLSPKKPFYACACATGVKLQSNNKTCEEGHQKFLLVARRTGLLRVSLDTPGYTDIVIPVSNVSHAIAIDYDPVDGLVYWTDADLGLISRAPLNGTYQEAVISTELEDPDGIAVDWVNRNLYWADTGTKRIETARLNGTNRQILISDKLDEPRALAIDPTKGYMYWTDWGNNARIERTKLDGTDRKVLINSGLGWPNGLALDLSAGYMYWGDAKKDRIEKATLEGKNRTALVTENLPHIFGLSLLDDYVYWTDWQKRSVGRVNKYTGGDRITVMNKTSDLMGIKAVDAKLGKDPIKTSTSITTTATNSEHTTMGTDRGDITTEVTEDITEASNDPGTGPRGATTVYSTVDPSKDDGEEKSEEGTKCQSIGAIVGISVMVLVVAIAVVVVVAVLIVRRKLKKVMTGGCVTWKSEENRDSVVGDVSVTALLPTSRK